MSQEAATWLVIAIVVLSLFLVLSRATSHSYSETDGYLLETMP